MWRDDGTNLEEKWSASNRFPSLSRPHPSWCGDDPLRPVARTPLGVSFARGWRTVRLFRIGMVARRKMEARRGWGERVRELRWSCERAWWIIGGAHPPQARGGGRAMSTLGISARLRHIPNPCARSAPRRDLSTTNEMKMISGPWGRVSNSSMLAAKGMMRWAERQFEFHLQSECNYTKMWKV